MQRTVSMAITSHLKVSEIADRFPNKLTGEGNWQKKNLSVLFNEKQNKITYCWRQKNLGFTSILNKGFVLAKCWQCSEVYRKYRTETVCFCPVDHDAHETLA